MKQKFSADGVPVENIEVEIDGRSRPLIMKCADSFRGHARVPAEAAALPGLIREIGGRISGHTGSSDIRR